MLTFLRLVAVDPEAAIIVCHREGDPRGPGGRNHSTDRILVVALARIARRLDESDRLELGPPLYLPKPSGIPSQSPFVRFARSSLPDRGGGGGMGESGLEVRGVIHSKWTRHHSVQPRTKFSGWVGCPQTDAVGRPALAETL